MSTPELPNATPRRLRAIHARLAKAFGPLEPPRAADPLDELILTVLSQHTSDLNAERAFAATLGGSCHSPIAAHATLADGTITVRGFIGAPDGSETFRDRVVGKPADAVALGRELARRMQAAGAEQLLERLRQEAAALT